MTDREKAEVNRMKADTSNIYVQMGAITNADVARQLMNDKDSEYESIEIPEPIDITEQEEEVNVGENGADSEIDKIIKDEEMSDAEFEESKHPRNSDGTFKENGAGENGAVSNGKSQEEINKRKEELKSKIKEPYYDKKQYERLKALAEKGKELGPRQKSQLDYYNKILHEYNTSIEEEAKATPPEDKASNALRQEFHNVEGYRYKKIDRNNFFLYTMANFNEVDKTPNREPDYISRSGSQYWYEDDGVYRKSNHWGADIATCDWFLNGDITRATLATSLPNSKIGFTKWEDFTNKQNVGREGINQVIHSVRFQLNPELYNKPVEIVNEPFGPYKDIKDLREKAKNYYKDQIQFTHANNPKLGKVFFTNKGLDKFISSSANENKLKMMFALRDIINTGKYEGTEPPKKERTDGVVKFHRISKTVKIGKETFKTSTLIAEDAQGNKFYNLNPNADEYIKDEAPLIPTVQWQVKGASKYSIANIVEKVKWQKSDWLNLFVEEITDEKPSLWKRLKGYLAND